MSATSGANDEVKALKNQVKELSENMKSLECEFEDMENSYKADIQSLQAENKVLNNQVNIPTNLNPLLGESCRSRPLTFGPPAAPSDSHITVSSHDTRTWAKSPEYLDHGDDVSSTDGSIVGGKGAEILTDNKNKNKRKRVSYSDVEYEEDDEGNIVEKGKENVIVIGDEDEPAPKRKRDVEDEDEPAPDFYTTKCKNYKCVCRRCNLLVLYTNGDSRPIRRHFNTCQKKEQPIRFTEDDYKTLNRSHMKKTFHMTFVDYTVSHKRKRCVK